MKFSWAAIRKFFTPETPNLTSPPLSFETGPFVPTVIVPLKDAHKILGTFGITKPTPDYERCVAEDGFALDDFQSLIGDSECVFTLDWRGWLKSDLERMICALGKLGVSAEMKSPETGLTAAVTINGKTAELSYIPNDPKTSWFKVISGLQSIVPQNIEFRQSVDNGGSDTEVYAVLQKDEWLELENEAGDSIRSLFVPLVCNA